MRTEKIEGNCSVVELPPTAIDKLNRKINTVNSNLKKTNNEVSYVSSRVADITPYEESKKAYIGDAEATFGKAKEGIVNANCITESGLSVPTALEVTNSEIKVIFEPLEELATVTISIQ